jgi:hypothetical protein
VTEGRKERTSNASELGLPHLAKRILSSAYRTLFQVTLLLSSANLTPPCLELGYRAANPSIFEILEYNNATVGSVTVLTDRED